MALDASSHGFTLPPGPLRRSHDRGPDDEDAEGITSPVTPATRIDTELAIRDWARRDDRAAVVVERVDVVRTGYLREIFLGFCPPEEAEARTVIAVSVRLASEVMSFGHGPYGAGEVADLVMARLLA